MQRLFTLVSIVGHAIVITSLFVAQLVAVGDLPIPHQPLTFEGARIVRVIDIPLPPPQRAATRDGAPPASLNAAPIVAPSGVRSETGFEGASPAVSDTIGVTRGIDSGFVIGGESVPAPPPPPPAPPAPPVRLHAGMQQPRALVHVNPAYPAIARAAHIDGVVILEAVIDTRGSVSSVRVLRSIPLLDAAAIDAVRQWTYTPTLLNGTPVPIIMTVTVQFKLE